MVAALAAARAATLGGTPMNSVTLRPRALGSAFALAVVLTTGGSFATGAPVAEAAPCVRFVASNWDAPGDDNYMPQLNKEWVRIKNTCSTTKSIGSWRIHDYGAKHTYKFPSTFKIKPGVSVTLRSGTGTNSATTRYWQRPYGAVWNNTGKEKAYLKNASGATIHTWVEAGR
jgi:hypothetical protein